MVKSNVWLAREWNATYVVIFGQWIVLLFRTKMGENARSNVFDASKCLSEACHRAKFGILFVLVWLIIWPSGSKTWAAWSKKARISNCESISPPHEAKRWTTDNARNSMGENSRSNVFDASKCLSKACQNAKFGILYVLVWLIIWPWRSKTWAAWSKKARISQGHPTTVFCKICVRRSKYYIEFSITWGRLKSSRWPFHLCRIFEASLIT